MTDRQKEILSFLHGHENASREEVRLYLASNGFACSKVTILRDIDGLISCGMVEPCGAGRSMRYRAGIRTLLAQEIDVERYFAKKADERDIRCAYFNFDIFGHLHDVLTQDEAAEASRLNDVYRTKRSNLSKCLLRREIERLTVELSWKSSRIEGNTYSLLETERLLKEHVVAGGKTLEETQMLLNHKRAIEYVFSAPEQYASLSVSKIEDIHSLLTDGLGVPRGIRSRAVGIIGTNYRPLDNRYQIREAMEDSVRIINETENPVAKALLATAMIAYIQPFEDGNKRTSRITANAILLANDCCPLSYRSVNEIEYKKGIILFYEQNSLSYFKKLFLDQFRSAVETYF